MMRNRMMVTSSLPMYCWQDDMAIVWLPSSDERQDLTLRKPLKKWMLFLHTHEATPSESMLWACFLLHKGVLDLWPSGQKGRTMGRRWSMAAGTVESSQADPLTTIKWGILDFGPLGKSSWESMFGLCTLLTFSTKLREIAFGFFMSPSFLSELEHGHGSSFYFFLEVLKCFRVSLSLTKSLPKGMAFRNRFPCEQWSKFFSL